MRRPILVVDDDPLNLELGQIMLTAAGYEVHTATDAQESRCSAWSD